MNPFVILGFHPPVHDLCAYTTCYNSRPSIAFRNFAGRKSASKMWNRAVARFQPVPVATRHSFLASQSVNAQSGSSRGQSSSVSGWHTVHKRSTTKKSEPEMTASIVRTFSSRSEKSEFCLRSAEQLWNWERWRFPGFNFIIATPNVTVVSFMCAKYILFFIISSSFLFTWVFTVSKRLRAWGLGKTKNVGFSPCHDISSRCCWPHHQSHFWVNRQSILGLT